MKKWHGGLQIKMYFGDVKALRENRMRIDALNKKYGLDIMGLDEEDIIAKAGEYEGNKLKKAINRRAFDQSRKRYKDQTYNLKASIGCVVFYKDESGTPFYRTQDCFTGLWIAIFAFANIMSGRFRYM